MHPHLYSHECPHCVPLGHFISQLKYHNDLLPGSSAFFLPIILHSSGSQPGTNCFTSTPTPPSEKVAFGNVWECFGVATITVGGGSMLAFKEAGTRNLVYSFPVDVEMKCYQLHRLKQHTLTIWQFCRSESERGWSGLKARFRQGCSPYWKHASLPSSVRSLA